MKILHSADWHWEQDKLDKCNASSDFIIETLRRERPDVHVIAGDYWNRRQTLNDSSAVIPALNAIKDMANLCPTVIIKGNEAHDNGGSLEVFKGLGTVYPIYVADRAETIGLFRKNIIVEFMPAESFDEFPPDLILHLLPFPEKSQFLARVEETSVDASNMKMVEAIRSILLGFGAISHGQKVPSVLVGHLNVLGSRLSTGQTLVGQDILIDPADLELAGADVVCLGHIHETQKFRSNIWYSGSIYHANFGEVSPRHVLIHTVEKGSCQTKHVVIPSTPLSLHEAHYESATNSLRDGFEQADWYDAELRVRVYVTKEQRNLVTEEWVMAQYPNAKSYKVEFLTVPDERVRSSQIAHARTLREKMVEWGKVMGKEFDETVLAKADEAERAFRVEGGVTDGN